MAKSTASILSYVFHPIFYPPVLLILYLMTNPIEFGISEPFEDMVLIFQTVINCTLLPLISILIMWRVNLIPSIQMDDKMDRIGPYIAVMIFFIWYYLSVDLYGVAPVFRLYILGGIVSLIAVFIINIFSKVSLHAMGIAGLATNLLISYAGFGYEKLILPYAGKYLQIEYSTILSIVLLIVFIVLLSRLYLKKHNLAELGGGLLLGVFGQIIALKLIYII